MKMRAISPLLTLGITYLACSVHAQRIRLGQLTEQAIADGTMTQDADRYIGHEKTAEERVKEEETPSAADGDASVSKDSAVDEEAPVPISAILFSGAPGPKECRGRPMLNVSLSKPGSRHSTPTCYNVTGTGTAQCGNLVANKDDGCEARLFSEPDCLTFVNVAVFVPERKNLGGYMRSIEIRCGVDGAMPAPLNLPGLELPAVVARQGVRNVVRPVHLISAWPSSDMSPASIKSPVITDT